MPIPSQLLLLYDGNHITYSESLSKLCHFNTTDLSNHLHPTGKQRHQVSNFFHVFHNRASTAELASPSKLSMSLK